MTKADYTALLLIVDRSGSMASIATDMEGAIKNLLDEQRALPGVLTVDYVRFDDQIEYVHRLADPATVQIKIKPRNMTALNDAVGIAFNSFGATLAAMHEDTRPGKVLVAIVTDGHENASREYTGAQVKELIETQQRDYNWGGRLPRGQPGRGRGRRWHGHRRLLRADLRPGQRRGVHPVVVQLHDDQPHHRLGGVHRRRPRARPAVQLAVADSMAVPLPKKVTDLIGRRIWWQENAEDKPVVATVIGARWSGTSVRWRDGIERPGVELQLDIGEHELRWSMTYPAPNPEPDDDDESESVAN
jgi:hypothetical protein